MRVDRVLVGVMAVRHLVDRALEPDRAPLKTLVTTRLIKGASVRALTEATRG